jgi:glycerate 2-kinase
VTERRGLPVGVDPDRILRNLFAAALRAADPAGCVPARLPEPPRGRAVVIGAGKASAAMARAVERHWPGTLAGVVVTAAGCEVACEQVEVLVAGHPLPVAASARAAERLLQAVSGLCDDDLVIFLVSGGGSALLSLPAPGITLADKQAVTRALLRSGAPIQAINCVRRHLSGVKGGRLGAACAPARVVTLAISDVPGDRPFDIASGPTVADPTTCREALGVLDHYEIDVPRAVRAGLESGAWESVKPGDARLDRTEFRLVATPREALEAAGREARHHGLEPVILSDRLEGEAREVGVRMAELARQVAGGRGPVRAPCVLLSGGETTVTVKGPGRGGRNVEFLLAFGASLGLSDNVFALACDTDGVDGTDPIAGAVWRADTPERARAAGLDPLAYLEANDAHSFFEALGDSVVTGPTRTNVNDFRAVLVS